MYKSISIKLKVDQIDKAKKIADELSIPYQTLLRMIIVKGLREEDK